ncbi:MAG: magnesium transporter CorA family protein [Chloroflexi bacterium]|nr:magnesium transporter CorA family protein [Chloroflexota bacterium]
MTTGSAAPLADGPERDAGIGVAVMVDGIVREYRGEAAIEGLEGLLKEARQAHGVVWIDLSSPTKAQVERASSLLGLHPLIAEDILEGKQRAKLEATDDLIQIVLFALDDTADLRAHEIDLVVGDAFLLSSHPTEWNPRGGAHFRGELDGVMRGGPDHLLWAIFDEIVDAYFPFADRLEDTIDALQDAVMEQTDRDTLARVFGLKRQLIAVRRAVVPVREVLNQLTNRELALIDPAELLYFRDIYDHVIRLTDELDNDRELVTATLDVYLSQVNNNLSAIMKRLTGVTVIIAGVGAIAGIFGMSEAGLAFSGGEALGFWGVAVGTIAFSALAALVLHRVDWI